MKPLHCFFLFFLQTLYFFSFSQNLNIKFEHLDINVGLSQNHVMCILQDSRGFMWFGTRDGLNKYDGYKFTIYRNDADDDNSISNNFISAIVEDSKGFIWIATRGGGLNRYDRTKDKFTRYTTDAKNSNSLSSDLLNGLAKDNDDNLWISTEDGGLNYFEPGKNLFLRYTHDKNDEKSLSDNNTRCVFADSKQKIWIGTYGSGLNLFDRRTKKFIRYTHDENNSASLSHNNVRVIFEDSKHRIWIGTVGGGLDLFDKNTGTFRHFTKNDASANSISNNVIGALGEDNEGKLWIGTENGGLDIYNPVTGIFQHYAHDEINNRSISQNSIYSIYRDRQNDMWVGTFAGGINLSSVAANKFMQYGHTSSKNSLSDNNVLSISESRNGKLWIGTDGGGLNLFDPLAKNFTHFRHDEKNKNSICGDYILSVCEDSKGNVWVGTWGNGITIFNPQKNSYDHFKNNPNDVSSLSGNNAWVIFEDRDKKIWVGTYGGGLNLYDPEHKSFIRFDDTTTSIVIKQIYSINEDKKGNLMIGTDGGGLRIFNKNTRTFSSFMHEKNKNSLSDNRINYIFEDWQGNFWIGTMSGLNYFDTKKNKFTVYTIADGLPNNVIFGILADKSNNMWISTNKGISRFSPNTKEFVNFSPADGLQSYEFKAHSLCKTKSGVMYFGGINGFNEFYPDKTEEGSFDPPLVFTNFQIFNKNIPIAKDDKDPSPLKEAISEIKAIKLAYKNSVISFEFASLNYTDQSKKQYSYILEGFDKDWNDIGTQHTATYTNLDPGKYVFKVKGLNNEGKWSSTMADIRLIITPPFWMTWWFRLAVLAGLAGSVVAFYTYRMKKIKIQQTKLKRLVNEQTLQLIQSTEEEHRARKQAEEFNKKLELKNTELEQFAYIASHDMQEPLRTTSNFAELLQKRYKGKLDEKADAYFTFILQSVERMRVLIKDLLDYSRIGREKEWESVDCNMILQETLADLAIALKESHAEIKSCPLPVINGYPTEIKQLFQNLIVNAIKFRKKDVNPIIGVSVKKIKGYFEFAVTDNGIGIDKKHSEKIFIIFQRLHNRVEYKGSGIGLAHCKKIVEMHGGKIWIDSEQGHGTTFYFTIRENKA